MFMKVLLLFTYFILVLLCSRMVEFYVSSIGCWQCLTTLVPALFDDLISTVTQQFNPHQQQKSEHQHGEYYTTENMESAESGSQEPSRTTEDAEGDMQITQQINNFGSYEEFQENLKDTTSIWVVKVTATRRKDIVNRKQWNWMSQRLKRYGIKMATYKCSQDSRLCAYRKLRSSTIVLATPKGYGVDVDFQVYENEETTNGEKKDVIYQWIKRKLNPKVKTVHSFSELTERPISRYKYNTQSKPSMSFVYKSNGNSPPLLFTSLSVKFAGRIKFYMFRTKEVSSGTGNVFAMNPNTIYNYGEKQGEQFTYSCIEFFLRTLHPEVNDVFVASVILLNMACWLELFLQKGGPLKRLFYYAWGFAIANIILVSVWLLIIQLLYMPEVQPFIEYCLNSFQQIMFTNFASVIRQDVIQLSKHLHIVFSGFVGYGILLGYLHYKFQQSSETSSFNSLMDVIRYDIDELRDLFGSLIRYITPSLRIYRFEESIERILHRLATPDLWLHSKSPTDYIHNLPTWNFLCNETDCQHTKSKIKHGYTSDDDTQSESETYTADDDSQAEEESGDVAPRNKMSEECVICLDLYKCGDELRGLPCDHGFHKKCIDGWLFTSSEVSHQRCPVCRWPADIQKGEADVIDFT